MSNIFDILIHQVNGLTKMNKPKCWKHQINAFVEDQIGMGIYDFSKMDDLDKDRLCTLMTQELGGERYTAITEIDDIDSIVCAALDYINSYSPLKSYDLAESIRFGLHQRFESAADEIFQELLHDIYVNECMENGLHKHIDPINGEVSYIK